MLSLSLGSGFHRHLSPETHCVAGGNWGGQLGSIVASLGTGPPDRVWDWLKMAATKALAHAKAAVKASVEATAPLHAKAAGKEAASAAHGRHGQHACMDRCRQQSGSVTQWATQQIVLCYDLNCGQVLAEGQQRHCVDTAFR